MQRWPVLSFSDPGQQRSTKRSQATTQPKVDFETFFKKDYRRIIAFLICYGLTREKAEDYAMDAMVIAFSKWDQIENPAPWLIATAKNLAIKGGRRTARDAIEWAKLNRESPKADGTEKYRGVEHNEELRELLAPLKKQQRSVIALHFIGYKNTEISEALNMTENTVRSNLRHAKKALKKIAEDRIEGGLGDGR